MIVGILEDFVKYKGYSNYKFYNEYKINVSRMMKYSRGVYVSTFIDICKKINVNPQAFLKSEFDKPFTHESEFFNGDVIEIVHNRLLSIVDKTNLDKLKKRGEVGRNFNYVLRCTPEDHRFNVLKIICNSSKYSIIDFFSDRFVYENNIEDLFKLENSLAKRVEQLVGLKKITLEDLARGLNINNVETLRIGARFTNISAIIEVCNYFKISLADFFNFDKVRFKKINYKLDLDLYRSMFSFRINKIKDEKKWTVKDIIKHLRSNKSEISRLLRGLYVEKTKKLFKICERLKISVHEFLNFSREELEEIKKTTGEATTKNVN